MLLHAQRAHIEELEADKRHLLQTCRLNADGGTSATDRQRHAGRAQPQQSTQLAPKLQAGATSSPRMRLTHATFQSDVSGVHTAVLWGASPIDNNTCACPKSSTGTSREETRASGWQPFRNPSASKSALAHEASVPSLVGDAEQLFGVKLGGMDLRRNTQNEGDYIAARGVLHHL